MTVHAAINMPKLLIEPVDDLVRIVASGEWTIRNAAAADEVITATNIPHMGRAELDLGAVSELPWYAR